jgi:adenylate kinase
MLQRERREKDEKRLTCAIVGPPGSIKGKLCELIVNEHGMKHVSGGEALRDAIKSGTEAGLRAQEARKDTGQVPEKLQTEIVGALLMSDALLDCGWLLDGLPRSRAQADALKAVGARLRRLIVVEVDDDELVRRATGRRIDPVTHTLYHDAGIGFPCPPEDEEVRARLTQRRDDTEERVRQRLEQFRVGNEVEAVAAEFEQVLRVDGSLDPAALMPLVSRFFAAPGPGDASAGTPPT